MTFPPKRREDIMIIWLKVWMYFNFSFIKEKNYLFIVTIKYIFSYYTVYFIQMKLTFII